MFSFGKKKKEPKKKITNRPSNSKRSPFDEFGLGPQPDDAELEAELQAITGKILKMKYVLFLSIKTYFFRI